MKMRPKPEKTLILGIDLGSLKDLILILFCLFKGYEYRAFYLNEHRNPEIFLLKVNRRPGIIAYNSDVVNRTKGMGQLFRKHINSRWPFTVILIDSECIPPHRFFRNVLDHNLIMCHTPKPQTGHV